MELTQFNRTITTTFASQNVGVAGLIILDPFICLTVQLLSFIDPHIFHWKHVLWANESCISKTYIKNNVADCMQTHIKSERTAWVERLHWNFSIEAFHSES